LIERSIEAVSVAGLRRVTHSSGVRGQARDRAAILDIVAMGWGQVGFYLPREATPMVCFQGFSKRLKELGIGADHRSRHDLGHQGVLGRKMIIKPALCESGFSHELIEADTVHAALAKQPRRSIDD
jgi:hypothetical protein